MLGDLIHCCDHLISDFENGHKRPSKKQIAEIKNYMEALTIGDDDVIREAVDDKQ